MLVIQATKDNGEHRRIEMEVRDYKRIVALADQLAAAGYKVEISGGKP